RTSAIERIEVSAGRTTRGATIKGMLIGGLSGALLVGFGQLPEVNPSAKDFLKGAPLGLALGTLVGGIVGYSLGGERWVPGELRRWAAVAPRRGASGGVPVQRPPGRRARLTHFLGGVEDVGDVARER